MSVLVAKVGIPQASSVSTRVLMILVGLQIPCTSDRVKQKRGRKAASNVEPSPPQSGVGQPCEVSYIVHDLMFLAGHARDHISRYSTFDSYGHMRTSRK